MPKTSRSSFERSGVVMKQNELDISFHLDNRLDSFLLGYIESHIDIPFVHSNFFDFGLVLLGDWQNVQLKNKDNFL